MEKRAKLWVPILIFSLVAALLIALIVFGVYNNKKMDERMDELLHNVFYDSPDAENSVSITDVADAFEAKVDSITTKNQPILDVAKQSDAANTEAEATSLYIESHISSMENSAGISDEDFLELFEQLETLISLKKDSSNSSAISISLFLSLYSDSSPEGQDTDSDELSDTILKAHADVQEKYDALSEQIDSLRADYTARNVSDEDCLAQCKEILAWVNDPASFELDSTPAE